MSINYLTIHNMNDFKQIIDSPIFIGCDKMVQEIETSKNMWAISIDTKILKNISASVLFEFITTLLHNRIKQISQLNISCPVIFYMWFDEMVGQLRFNIISELNKALPFSCSTNIIDSPHPILINFLQSQHNPDISWNDLEEINDDDNDIEENDFILDVFVAKLNNKS